MSGLRLGTLPERKSEGVWLFITVHEEAYVTWDETVDEEFREALGIAPGATVAKIKVRRFNNPDRNAFIREQFKKWRKVGLTAELQQRVVRASVANTVLEDWKGIAPPPEALKGLGWSAEEAETWTGEVDYSPDLGVKTFEADPDFYEAVIAAASEEQHYRDQDLNEKGEALGN